jgi:hypothetical protein
MATADTQQMRDALPSSGATKGTIDTTSSQPAGIDHPEGDVIRRQVN